MKQKFRIRWLIADALGVIALFAILAAALVAAG